MTAKRKTLHVASNLPKRSERVDQQKVTRLIAEFNPGFVGDPEAELHLFDECANPRDAREVLRAQIQIHVGAILDLVEEADAFDVIELMRLREFAVTPDPRSAPVDGSPLPVEILAAVLLARGARKPHPVPRSETNPSAHVEELHRLGLLLGRLATYRHHVEASFTGDPIAELTAQHQSSVMTTRNLQFEHIRRAHEEHLFTHPVVAPLMLKTFGLRYPDIIAVRDAIRSLSGRRMTTLRDRVGELAKENTGRDATELDPQTRKAFEDAIGPLWFLPGERAAFTAADIAAETGLPKPVVAHVLETFAQRFDPTVSATQRVYDLLAGENPFLREPLVYDGVSFAATTNEIGADALRRALESALPKPSADFTRYDQKARQVVSETLTLQHLETILGAPAAHAGFKYFAPRAAVAPETLGKACPNPAATADQVEADGLFLIDDVAICVEVKAKSLSAQAARGDINRLNNELKDTIRSGANQALRLQQLIETNGGVWLADKTWLDLSHVRETRSIVSLLDDIGPLSTGVHDLQLAGMLPEHNPPWITSIHDLAVIAEICDSPSEFLLYLRRRTDSGVARYFSAYDELDLYMYFLSGNLYVAPDPDEIHARYPSTPRPTAAARRQHRDDAVETLVGDQSVELNAWMNRHQLPDEQPKPELNCTPRARELVETLTARRDPGWLRAGADLLALSGDGQRRVERAIDECARRSRSDGLFHTSVYPMAGVFGHPALFLGVRPAGWPADQARERLELYMTAKRYQLSSDRSLGFLVNDRGTVEDTVYLNDPVVPDPSLDLLVAQLQLQPIQRHPPVPPSAKRSTVRLRGKKSR